MITVRQPLNDPLLAYLAPRGATADDREPHADGRDYLEAGSHPDVVDRVWNQLGRPLPFECRRVVGGTPALVQPSTKVILAAALGTMYVMRLPPSVLRAGIPPNVRTDAYYVDTKRLNVRERFGAAWIFGDFVPVELDWCARAFDEYATLPP